jgi:hypothetical protein
MILGAAFTKCIIIVEFSTKCRIYTILQILLKRNPEILQILQIDVVIPLFPEMI